MADSTAEMEFLWVQLEDVIQRGQNKDAEPKLELLQRVYPLLAERQNDIQDERDEALTPERSD